VTENIDGKPRTTRGGSHAAASPPPPSGLSRGARALWSELHASHVFEVHEELNFAHALKWLDLSDALLREAAKLKGRERIARLKSAADAAATSLKFFRTLRFVDPARPARGPGRPPGKPWPPAALAAVRTLGDAHR
jgi:hypothetical protein